MKKLVAVSAMAALLAGAAFAADITGASQLTFDAFKFNTNSKDFTVIGMPNEHDNEAKIRLSVSDEKSGATLKYESNDDGKLDGSIWFKPVDEVKVSLSNGGMGVDVTVDALGIGGTLGGTVLDNTYTEPKWSAYVSYAMEDVATVKVEGGKDSILTKNNSEWSWAPVTGYAVAAEVSTSAIPSTSLSTRVGYYNTDKKMDLKVNATETLGDIKIEENVEAEGSFEAEGAVVPAYVKVTLPVSDLSLALKAETADAMEITDAKATVSATLSGTFGVVSYDAALKVEASPAEGATISIPLTAKVSF